MNYYCSRLMKGPGYIDQLPDNTYPGIHKFDGVVYQNKIYFIMFHNPEVVYNLANPSKAIDLYSWDGVKSSPTFVDTFVIDYQIAPFGSSSLENSTSGLIVYNDELYLVGMYNGIDYMYKLLPNFVKINATYPTITGSALLDSGRYYALKQVLYVVYNNKIHVFECPNETAVNYMLKSSSTTAADWYQYLGQHYSFDGTSWTRESSTDIWFYDDSIPVVWKNKIYLRTINYIVEAGSKPYYTNYYHKTRGSTFHCYDGNNWSVFYSKTGYPPVVDTTNTSSNLHRLYYKTTDGNYPTSYPNISSRTGACVLNGELYLFDIDSKLYKYSESLSEFVLLSDSYPQYPNVTSDKMQWVTLIPFKDCIYAYGGCCWVNKNGNTTRQFNYRIYRYNTSSGEWEHPVEIS